MNIIKVYLAGWDFMRIFRLVMGVVALGQAIAMRELLLGAAGSFLIFMAMANIGCCGVNGCVTRPVSSTPEMAEDISFEEVRSN
jgi:hypothetical protein